MRKSGLLLRCMVHALLLMDSVEKMTTQPVYVRGPSHGGQIPATEDAPSRSVIDCGRRCYHKNCHGFYYERSSRQCRLVTSLFSITYQPVAGPLELYHKVDAQSLLNSLDICPTMSGEETTVVTASSELTFRVYIDAINHPEAWDACLSQGLRLMKIDTPEKQAAVRHVLNTCPVLSPHQYWLDGYKNMISGVWQFADGSLVPMDTIHFWLPGKPNDDNSCVRTLYEHKWDDRECDIYYMSYICE